MVHAANQSEIESRVGTCWRDKKPIDEYLARWSLSSSVSTL